MRSGLTKSGMCRLPPDSLVSEKLFGESLIFLQVIFPGAASGVRQTEHVEQADHVAGAEQAIAEGFHEVENQVGLAPRQTGNQLPDVAVNAQDGNAMSTPAQRPRDLRNNLVRVGIGFSFQIGEDRDPHGSPR
jgi:hypothetical protein